MYNYIALGESRHLPNPACLLGRDGDRTLLIYSPCVLYIQPWRRHAPLVYTDKQTVTYLVEPQLQETMCTCMCGESLLPSCVRSLCGYVSVHLQRFKKLCQLHEYLNGNSDKSIYCTSLLMFAVDIQAANFIICHLSQRFWRMCYH